MEKDEIQKELGSNGRRINRIIFALNEVDSSDKKVGRLSRNEVTTTLFDLVESISNVELDIYNYLEDR